MNWLILSGIFWLGYLFTLWFSKVILDAINEDFLIENLNELILFRIITIVFGIFYLVVGIISVVNKHVIKRKT
jgi:hypothetical protein